MFHSEWPHWSDWIQNMSLFKVNSVIYTRVILHVPRSTILSFLSLPDYDCKSKKIISIRQISKPTLYEMPFCMYQMTKRRRHKSKLQLAHNSWPTNAHHLLCKRISAVVRPEILTNSKTYTIFSNNLYYVFQQHISNIPTNKKGWIIYLWHTLFAKSDTQLILSYNIILKLIIPILQPFGNIFPIFHKALFLLFLVQITIAKIPPVNIYNQN